MTALLRALPGLIALVLSFLCGYLWTQLGQLNLFTVSHIGSAVVCVSVPIAFVLAGRKTRCRPTQLKLGAILLGIAGVPMLIANGIYLFSFRTPQAAVADIGGFLLMLLGLAGLLATSLAFTIALPLTRPINADRLANEQGPSSL